VATVGLEVAEVGELIEHPADGPLVTVDPVVLDDVGHVEGLALAVGRGTRDGLLVLCPGLGDVAVVDDRPAESSTGERYLI
jgi:hypothetical protein